MELSGNDILIAATRHYTGSEMIEVTEGKRLIIETSPNGEEILDAIVPKGKQWKASVVVNIYETDI